MLLGLVVFAAVYALLAVPRLGRRLREAALARSSARWAPAVGWLLGRPGIVLTGALLVVVVGAVAPRVALESVDLGTLALLAGMMLLVGALECANFFAVLASRLAAALPTPTRLLAGSMILVAILSALVLNDAVVLLFTPVLVRAARSMETSPIPFLVGEALAANLGSVATPVGNPQNAAIALDRGISFTAFASALLPLAVMGLALGVVMALLFFRKDLSRHAARAAPPVERISNRPMFALALGSVVLALAGFVLGPALGIPLWASALGAGMVALVAAPAARVNPLRVARGVDTGILIFFVGLFVLLETVRNAGALDLVADGLSRGGSGAFVVATALLSNLVSNVPAVLLLLPTVTSDQQALLLAAASTYAGNATFLGSAATVIVAETARANGEDFSVLRFTLIGLPLAVLTLLLSWLLLG